MKNFLFLLFIISVTALVISCQTSNYGLKYTAIDNEERKPIVPCDIKIYKKMPKDSTNYKLIGTCESKFRMGGGIGGYKNKAFEEILKCSCQAGGEVLKLNDHKVESENIASTTPSGAMSSHHALYDVLIGEVYINKESE